MEFTSHSLNPSYSPLDTDMAYTAHQKPKTSPFAMRHTHNLSTIIPCLYRVSHTTSIHHQNSLYIHK